MGSLVEYTEQKQKKKSKYVMNKVTNENDIILVPLGAYQPDQLYVCCCNSNHHECD